MSNNYWRQETYAALIALAQAKVRYTNTQGQLVAPDVVVRTLDEDFTIATYPSVSIYIYGSSFAPKRQCDASLTRVSMDYSARTGQFRLPFKPYTLVAQLDFWAEKQTHLDDMMHSWLYAVGDNYPLSVIDSDGLEKICPMNSQSKLFNFDLLNTEGAPRKCRSILTYEVWAGLNSSSLATHNIVVERDITNATSDNTIVIIAEIPN